MSKHRGPPQQIQRTQPPPKTGAVTPVEGIFRQQSQGQAHITVEQQVSTSPLPMPAIMEAYDRILPGLSSDIREWTREEHAHRREMERMDRQIAEGELKRNHARQLWAMGGAFGVVVIFAGLAFFAMDRGQEYGAVAAILAAASPIVGHFLNKRNTPAQEEPAA